MSYLPQVINAKYLHDFVIAATFDDGSAKCIDLSPWLRGPVFKPLKDKKYFQKFFIEGGTLAWPNGVDIAPESLYGAEDISQRHNKPVERNRPRKARSNRSR
jgi:hypothetical protein